MISTFFEKIFQTCLVRRHCQKGFEAVSWWRDCCSLILKYTKYILTVENTGFRAILWSNNKNHCMLSPVLFLQLSFSENGLFTRRRKRKKLQAWNIVLRYKRLDSTASRWKSRKHHLEFTFDLCVRSFVRWRDASAAVLCQKTVQLSRQIMPYLQNGSWQATSKLVTAK